jgi:hypothetical protein
MDEKQGPIEVASMEALIAAIQPITSKGLPVTDEVAGDLLPNL